MRSSSGEIDFFKTTSLGRSITADGYIALQIISTNLKHVATFWSWFVLYPAIDSSQSQPVVYHSRLQLAHTGALLRLDTEIAGPGIRNSELAQIA